MKKILFLPILFLIFSANLFSQNLSGIRIYINPGHGGYDSDDRNVVIPPFKQGDPNGFWESVSNLEKGKYLKEMLDSRGATTAISRVTNTTADDLPLTQIVRSANEFNSDFMLSIHSNAGNGARSAVLMLFAGISPTDPQQSYPTATPHSETSRLISTEIAKNLYSNEATSWSSSYSVQGDKTFGRTAMGWSDGYGVLRGLKVPGVISEGSHHDYFPETYRLMNQEYRWLEAWHFLKSFATYFKSATLPKGNIAGVVKDRFLPNNANYPKIPNTLDVYLPVNGATVTLLPQETTYTVDNLNNGFYLFKDLEPGTYKVVVKHSDYHNDTTEVVVSANKTSYANIRPNKIRNTPPQVIEHGPIAVAPNETVLASSSVRFKFNWDIDTESAQQAFSISPAVEGRFEFKESNFVMEFIPKEPLATSTIFTVKLAKTLRHFDGLSMENDFTFSFKTGERNQLTLLAAYPLENEANIDYKSPVFTFVFDKKLQTAELSDGVQVYDSQGKVLVKNLRSVRNNTVPEPFGSTSFMVGEDLIPNQKYTVKIAAGIKDMDNVFLTEPIVIPFTASDERKTDKSIAETFENSDRMVVDIESNTHVTAATATRNSATKLFNTYSYNLKYTFSTAEGGSVQYNFAEPLIEVANDSTVGLHIFGDLSGNEIYLVLDNALETREIKLDSIHYGGWKYVSKSLSNLIPDALYRLTGFKIIQKETPLSKTGNLFIDNLLVYKSDGSTSVSTEKVRNVSFYPNPAKEIINIARAQHQKVISVELYSLKGRLIKSTYFDFITVSEIPNGTYLLKVRLNEGVVTKPVIINR